MNYPHRMELPFQFDIPHPDVMWIDAERTIKNATAQLVRYHFLEPADHPLYISDNYRLELSLTQRPRNSRACYEDVWSPKRFERIGSTFLIPPQREFQGKSDGAGKAQVVLCELKPEALHDWLDTEFEWTDHRLLACLDIQDANIRHLLLRLASELKHPGFASEAFVEMLIGQLGIELSRYCAGAADMSAAGGLSAWRLRLIDERVNGDSRAPSLSELAELCQLSVRQLARGFKVSRGCSIGAYVANCRVEHAKKMLVSGPSIKAIAYSLGFSSSASFIYAFRQATGLTPLEFRKKLLHTR